mmetsp:Transcript_84130/g.214162  ORF Transcript_84130/g.214162 Transcript_84130/m.214162 type:complete len:336 (-) Transcript_84130:13-1020(-)
MGAHRTELLHLKPGLAHDLAKREAVVVQHVARGERVQHGRPSQRRPIQKKHAAGPQPLGARRAVAGLRAALREQHAPGPGQPRAGAHREVAMEPMRLAHHQRVTHDVEQTQARKLNARLRQPDASVGRVEGTSGNTGEVDLPGVVAMRLRQTRRPEGLEGVADVVHALWKSLLRGEVVLDRGPAEFGCCLHCGADRVEDVGAIVIPTFVEGGAAAVNPDNQRQIRMLRHGNVQQHLHIAAQGLGPGHQHLRHLPLVLDGLFVDAGHHAGRFFAAVLQPVQILLVAGTWFADGAQREQKAYTDVGDLVNEGQSGSAMDTYREASTHCSAMLMRDQV